MNKRQNKNRAIIILGAPEALQSRRLVALAGCLAKLNVSLKSQLQETLLQEETGSLFHRQGRSAQNEQADNKSPSPKLSRELQSSRLSLELRVMWEKQTKSIKHYLKKQIILTLSGPRLGIISVIFHWLNGSSQKSRCLRQLYNYPTCHRQ